MRNYFENLFWGRKKRAGRELDLPIRGMDREKTLEIPAKNGRRIFRGWSKMNVVGRIAINSDLRLGETQPRGQVSPRLARKSITGRKFQSNVWHRLRQTGVQVRFD